MRYLVTAAEMKQYDKNTIEKIGVPGLVLMERAALKSVEAMKKSFLDGKFTGNALILAGVGNNGGDGLAIARLLADEGIKSEVWIVGDIKKASDQWIVQKKILDAYSEKGTVTFVKEPGKDTYTMVIDALFGVGLSRNAQGDYAKAIKRCNEIKGFKVAIDVPSGIHSDNGKVMGTAFKAELTVTFGFGKRGLFLGEGSSFAGKVITSDIGINEMAFMEQEPKMFYYDEPVKDLLPKRNENGNKGTFGKVLLIAGSKNMTGAAILAAKASLCAGCGMVKVLSDEDNRIILQQAIPDAMFGEYSDLQKSLEWCDVIAIGPGLSQSEEAYDVLKNVLEFSDKPLIIDADGLNLIAKSTEGMEALKKQTKKGRQIILSPHVGELSRLMKVEIDHLKEDPIEQVAEFTKDCGCIVVEKDAKTCVFEPGDRIFLNPKSNSGLAVAGSGDVLCGLMAGILAQSKKAYEAACVGVMLHVALGEREVRLKTAYGTTASGLVSCGLTGII